MAKKELSLKEFLAVSLRLGPLLGDIEKLAVHHPSKSDQEKLWLIHEDLLGIYSRFMNETKGTSSPSPPPISSRDASVDRKARYAKASPEDKRWRRKKEK